MKILNLFLAALLCGCGAQNAVGEINADGESLDKALLLSKEVKKYEKSIGILPSNILTETAKKMPAKSILDIYIIEKRVIATFENMGHIQFYFPSERGRLAIEKAYTGLGHYSVYYRQNTVVADESQPMPITVASC